MLLLDLDVKVLLDGKVLDLDLDVDLDREGSRRSRFTTTLSPHGGPRGRPELAQPIGRGDIGNGGAESRVVVLVV